MERRKVKIFYFFIFINNNILGIISSDFSLKNLIFENVKCTPSLSDKSEEIGIVVIFLLFFF